jgi:hypothetical protein
MHHPLRKSRLHHRWWVSHYTFIQHVLCRQISKIEISIPCKVRPFQEATLIAEDCTQSKWQLIRSVLEESPQGRVGIRRWKYVYT